MWTAVRLLAVCVLGVIGLFVLRSGSPSRQPPPVSVPHRDVDDIVLVTLAEKPNEPPVIDDGGKKVVKPEIIRLGSLDAQAKAQPQPERETHYRRHVHYRHWHRYKRRRRG
jgi:hypothetical protein